MDRMPLKQTHRDLDSTPPSDGHGDDDAISYISASTDTLRKPLQPFDDSHLEDAMSRRPRRKSWWDTMAVRARRRIDLGEYSGEATEGLLGDSQASSVRPKRKRTWYNYCIFGGISGLCIL